MPEVKIILPKLHDGQKAALRASKRFNVFVCGRQWGKTTLAMYLASMAIIDGKTVGWFAPEYKYLTKTYEEVETRMKPIVESANASLKRIKLKTGGEIEFWSLDDEDAGRSRNYDLVIIDEAGLVEKLAEWWRKAGRATLLKRKGKAFFISTPKPPRSIQLKDYAFYQFAQREKEDTSWFTYHAPSRDNPHLSEDEITAMRNEPGMTARAAMQEIDAIFLTETSDALWTFDLISPFRIEPAKAPNMLRMGIFLDPAVTSGEDSDATGIVVVGQCANSHYYIINDFSGKYTPNKMAMIAVRASQRLGNCPIYYEQNQGGDFIKAAIKNVSSGVTIIGFPAVNGKPQRAESVLGLYEQGRVHHVGEFPLLEDEMVNWNPFDKKAKSPNRVDAAVHGLRVFSKVQQVEIRKVNRISYGYQGQGIHSS